MNENYPNQKRIDYPQKRDPNPCSGGHRMVEGHLVKLSRPLHWVSPSSVLGELSKEGIDSCNRIQLDAVHGRHLRGEADHVDDGEGGARPDQR